MKGYQIENSILYVCTMCLVLGLYYISSSMHSLWGMLLLLAISYEKGKEN